MQCTLELWRLALSGTIKGASQACILSTTMRFLLCIKRILEEVWPSSRTMLPLSYTSTKTRVQVTRNHSLQETKCCQWLSQYLPWCKWGEIIQTFWENYVMTNGPAGHDNNAQSRTRDLTYSGTQLIENGLLGKLKWRDIGLTLFDVMDHGMSRCESNVVV